MIYRILTAKAIILVLLAAIQGIVLVAFPMVNYWQSDIEDLLSDRLKAEVTVSEITARVSWTGPYLEVLNLSVKRPEGSVEIRRVQMLFDLSTSLAELKPVVGQLILDEGEIIQRGLGAGIPEPHMWGSLLEQLHEVIRPIGAFRLYNFDINLGEVALERLTVEIDPEIGILAHTVVVTEDLSLPLEIDWRYPSKLNTSHDVRLNTKLSNATMPVKGSASFSASIDATFWLSIALDKPVEGIIYASARADDIEDFDGKLKGRMKFSGLDSIVAEFESLQLQIPGVQIAGPGGGIEFDESRITARLPQLSIDGEQLGAFLKSYFPEFQLLQLLKVNAPNIVAKDIQIDWPNDQPPLLMAEIDSFDIKAAQSIPELGVVGGTLYLNGTRGWFDFTGGGVSFAVPDIFPSPWINQSVSGTLAFDQSDLALVIRGQALRVQDAFQEVVGSLLLELPRNKERQLHLELIVNAKTEALISLLPRALNSEVLEFVNRTVQDVKVESGRISFSGPLDSLIDGKRSDLSMRLPIVAYRLKPFTDWPAFEGDRGIANFVNQRASIDLVDSDFGGISVSKLTGRQSIESDKKIEIDGHVSGAAPRVLAILDAAGVKPESLGSQILLDGRLRGDIEMIMPIGESLNGRVLIEADNLTVSLAHLGEKFTEVNGKAEFRLHDGLYTDLLSGRLLGDPVEAIVTIAGGVTDVRGKARLQSQHINQMAGLGLNGRQLYGQSDWMVEWRGENQQWKLSAETDGRGLGSRLPHPLGKEPQTLGNVVVDLKSHETQKKFSARIFDITEVSGEFGLHPLTLEVVTPEADLFGWTTLSEGDSEQRNLSILLRTNRLIVGETSLDVSETAILLRPQNLEISFAGSQLAGRIEKVGQGPLEIDLEKLILPDGGDFLGPPGEDPLIDYDPGQLPSARIRVNTLIRGDKRYRDLNLFLVSGESRLDAISLEFERDGQRFQGELAWVHHGGKAETALILSAQGRELGNILRANKNEPLLEANSGRFVSRLRWDGSPLGFSILTSDGSVELSLKDGRFLDLGNSAEVLRLFGILNIETITRRLQLDFLDLVQPGVAFDSVDAEALLSKGVLTFDPEFSMRGPSSSFRLTGTADLANQRLNQMLEVDIPLTNNLPLASILLGAPQIGGAIYLVEKVFGRKIIKVGKTDYRIEGSFDDPSVSLLPPFSGKKDELNVETPPNGQ